MISSHSKIHQRLSPRGAAHQNNRRNRFAGKQRKDPETRACKTDDCTGLLLHLHPQRRWERTTVGRSTKNYDQIETTVLERHRPTQPRDFRIRRGKPAMYSTDPARTASRYLMASCTLSTDTDPETRTASLCSLSLISQIVSAAVCD